MFHVVSWLSSGHNITKKIRYHNRILRYIAVCLIKTILYIVDRYTCDRDGSRSCKRRKVFRKSLIHPGEVVTWENKLPVVRSSECINTQFYFTASQVVVRVSKYFYNIQQIFLSVLCTYFCIPEIVLVWRGEARLENDYSAQCFIIANGTYNNLYKQ